MKRPLPGQFNGPRDVEWKDIGFEGDFPFLHDYLTSTKYEEGQSRVTATLLFFVENGCLKCCINDRDNNRSAFVNDATMVGLLEKLERGLKDETLDWRTRGQKPNPGNGIPY